MTEEMLIMDLGVIRNFFIFFLISILEREVQTGKKEAGEWGGEIHI